MKKRLILCVCVILMVVTFSAGAQGTPTLGITAAPVKTSGAIAKGQKTLYLVIAMGGADSFVSMHKARASVSVALSQ